jgi:hypothetical protein
MRYWLDTEFIEDGKTIDLISIGIVCEDGRELYLLNYDCDWSKAGQWVKDNVLSKLPDKPDLPFISRDKAEIEKRRNGYYNRDYIAALIREFCDSETYGKPEFWGYYSASDWVAFYQLFGTLMDLPKGYPFYCRDIKQWCDMLGNPQLPAQGKGEHNALEDARHNRVRWEFLDRLQRGDEYQMNYP